MRQVDRKAPSVLERRDKGDGFVGLDLPGRTTIGAVQVPMDRGRQDMELLAPIGGVAVAEQAEFLEHVERAVDGRWDRRRVDLATAFHQFGAGDVAVSPRQDLDERAALGRPAQSPRPQPIANALPFGIGLDSNRSSRGHDAKG